MCPSITSDGFTLRLRREVEQQPVDKTCQPNCQSVKFLHCRRTHEPRGQSAHQSSLASACVPWPSWASNSLATELLASNAVQPNSCQPICHRLATCSHANLPIPCQRAHISTGHDDLDERSAKVLHQSALRLFLQSAFMVRWGAMAR